MNEKQKQEVKKTIQEEIIKTEASIIEYKDITKPIAPENAIGRVSRMDAINNKSVVEAALRQAKSKLKNLNIVLDKIDDKDFGLCIKCKKPIPLGRIMLMPHSRLCVNCAS
ncbi:MAG: TraR/DksA C4-type zinc finger protein [Bacteroidota bacterium]|nr:TraR/DksA C4-type zinc finger protein [Bacteroidota bacterium]